MVDDSRRHEPPPALGETLRRARLARGLSLRQLGAAAGITYAYVSMLETGKRAPSQSVAAALIVALKLTGNDRLVVFRAAIPNVGRDWPGPVLPGRYRGAA